MLTTHKAGRLCLLTATIAALTASAFAQEIAPGRLLVKFKSGVSNARAAEIQASISGREIKRIDGIDVRVLKIPEAADPRAIAARLKQSGDVAFAEPDHIAHGAQSATTPNDPWFLNWQPQLRQINCPAAWQYTTGNLNVVIAIIDTGVNGSIPDLSPKVMPGWNVINNSSDTSDVNGHGTKVAAVAAAASNNGVGVASVAWNCKVMPIRAADANMDAYYSDLANGVMYAADHGARIVNLSFLVSRDSTLESALSHLMAGGGIAFCGAGNYGSDTGEPQNPYIVTVSGTGADSQWSPNSNYGQNVDIAAPYTDYTADMEGGYTAVGGTSFSTPMVAGAAALVVSVNPGLTSTQIEKILEQSATDEGLAGWDPYTGWGQVNVGKAVQMALGTTPVDSTPPTVSITSPSTNAQVSGITGVYLSAYDANGVDSAYYFVDGVQIGQVLAAPFTYSWDTTKTSDGTHTLTVFARDPSGNTGQTSVSVTVRNFIDTIAPTITITSPTAGSRLSKTVNTTVVTSDNVGVVRTATYLDGLLVASSTTAPFTMQWSDRTVASGLHTLQCKAYDAAGNCGVSASVSVRK